MAAYAVSELLLVPLGLAAPDPTDDDGVAVLVLAGVALPIAVVVVWAVVVRAIVRGFRLSRTAWLLALAGLLVPVVVFATVRAR